MALSLAFVLLVAVLGTLWVVRTHRDDLREGVSIDERLERWVVRIDPAPPPRTLQRAAWGVVTLAAGGLVGSWVLLSADTVAPSVALAGLATLGAGMLTRVAYERGWLWPAPSRRLGVGPDEVWWDAIDRQARPDVGPTSVATRVPRAEAELRLDGDYAVVTGASGRGVAFGPLPDHVREALLARWGTA
ncbi:MAG: hypothetical protein AAF211_04220 [Myxococcota bacterium]